nr:hypothetical protein [Micromonospora sp. DSM 115978]
MPRAGATAQRPVGGSDTGAHRLPVVHDEVAGTRRTLRVVFVLLVVMTGVAAFAVGGLITLRGGGSDAAVAPVGPEPIAAAVGRLASPAPTVPDPFDMLSPTVPAPGGVIGPPIIGLTPGPGATPTDPAATPTGSPGT